MAAVDDVVSVASEVDVPAMTTHKLGANLIFDDHGLDPYWGFVNAYEPDMTDWLEPVSAGGHRWRLENASHWNGKIAHPEQDWDEGLYEYRLQFIAEDDVGDRDVTISVRPGYPQATHVDTGNTIGGIPDDLPRCFRVQWESTNVPIDDALLLLSDFADALGWNQRYISEPHEWSSMYALERYLRVHRDSAEALVTGHNGVLQRMARFGSSEGHKGEYKWDHEEIEGHYEAVALDPDTWHMLVPDQEYPKRAKCYHPAHPRADADPDDPLSHPKLEMQYWSGYEDESVPWSQRHDIANEMTEAGANLLNWAGADLEPGSDVYVSDAYHDAGEAATSDVQVYSDPLDELDEFVERNASDELLRPDVTGGEFDVLEAVTDGGDGHYHEVAEQAGRSSSTVYRAVQRLGILEADNGTVQFPDIATREAVEDVVGRLRDAVDYAGTALRDVVEHSSPLSDRDEEPSALERWMSRHGVRLVEKYVDGERRLRFKIEQRVSELKLRSILRAGIQAAEGSSLLTTRFEDAYIDWVDLDGDVHNRWQIGATAENALRSL